MNTDRQSFILRRRQDFLKLATFILKLPKCVCAAFFKMTSSKNFLKTYYEVVFLFFAAHPPGQDVNGMPDDLYNNYEIGRVIGDGNFAVVKECTNR